jgi:glutathione S-transferase
MVKKQLGQGEAAPGAVAKGEQEFRRAGEVLNASLKGRKWLTGNELTLADFSVGPWMSLAQIAQYPVAGLTEIARWYDAFAALPAMKKALAPLQQR